VRSTESWLKQRS